MSILHPVCTDQRSVDNLLALPTKRQMLSLTSANSFTSRENYIHLIYIQRTSKLTSSRQVTEGGSKPTNALAMQRLCYHASKSLISLLSYSNFDNDIFMTVDPN